MKLFEIMMTVYFFLNANVTLAEEKQNNRNKEDEQSLKGIKTNIKNPFSLRDPFQRHIPRSILKKTIVDAVRQSEVERALKNVSLRDIKVIGVLLGAQRRAIAQVASETYMLKEGMYIGPGNKKLEVILPGGIVFVEKTTNVYDEDEYLETVIPVSTAAKTGPAKR